MSNRECYLYHLRGNDQGDFFRRLNRRNSSPPLNHQHTKIHHSHTWSSESRWVQRVQARVQVNAQYYNHPIYTVYNVVLGPQMQSRVQVQHCRRDHNGYGNDEIRARRDQAYLVFFVFVCFILQLVNLCRCKTFSFQYNCHTCQVGSRPRVLSSTANRPKVIKASQWWRWVKAQLGLD